MDKIKAASATNTNEIVIDKIKPVINKKEPTPRIEYDQRSITLYWDEGLDKYIETVLAGCSESELEQNILDLFERLNMDDDDIDNAEEAEPTKELLDAPSCGVGKFSLLTDLKFDRFHISLKNMLVPANIRERTSLYPIR